MVTISMTTFYLIVKKQKGYYFNEENWKQITNNPGRPTFVELNDITFYPCILIIA